MFYKNPYNKKLYFLNASTNYLEIQIDVRKRENKYTEKTTFSVVFNSSS